MRKIHKIHTHKRRALIPQKASKRRKTRLNISVDKEVAEVLNKYPLNRSRLINAMFRWLLFGEGEFMEFVEAIWRARRDSNPRLPAPKALKTFNDYWNTYKEQFTEWLSRRVATQTAKDYLNALTKFFDKYTIRTIRDLRKASEELNYKKNYMKGLRNFINFLVEEEILDEGTATLLKRPLKIKRGTPRQVFITTEELKEAYNYLKEKHGESAEVLLKLLVFTGLRLSQVVRLLNSYDQKNLVVVNDKVARYPMLSLSRGHKKAFWAYMPADFALNLRKMDITYYMGQTRTVYERVSPSTIRKWQYDVLTDHMSFEIADFIQGRSAQTVGERHYSNLTKKADEAYSRVVDKLKKVLEVM